jgi:hypothetical protein
VLVAATVAKFGVDGLLLTVLVSGLMLTVVGLLRLGALIRYIPHAVTVGSVWFWRQTAQDCSMASLAFWRSRQHGKGGARESPFVIDGAAVATFWKGKCHQSRFGPLLQVVLDGFAMSGTRPTKAAQYPYSK